MSDSKPGITRRRSGTGFAYFLPDGSPLKDSEELARVRSLVIPPAWSDVWICPSKNGHLQAVGTDARGRKQYRYHSSYREVRDATKFTRMIAFGMVLPKIRAQVAKDLSLPGLPRRKVLATVVRLLESTSIRVGNEEYRKQNESFGLTTLRNRHVQIDGRTLHFHFKGKSGQFHDVELTDRRLARIVAECQELPGHELFQFIDDEGNRSPVHSDDVNGYLREITGEDFTAKDFRTWNGSRAAAWALAAMGPADGESAVKKNIVAAVKETASLLGNRPATCRKYYVHPAVFDHYSNGTLFEITSSAEPDKAGLTREEVAVMRMVAIQALEAGASLVNAAQVAMAEIQVVPSSSVDNRA